MRAKWRLLHSAADEQPAARQAGDCFASLAMTGERATGVGPTATGVAPTGGAPRRQRLTLLDPQPQTRHFCRMSDRYPPELEMRTDGSFRAPPRPPILTRIFIWAAVIAVIAGGLAAGGFRAVDRTDLGAGGADCGGDRLAGVPLPALACPRLDQRPAGPLAPLDLWRRRSIFHREGKRKAKPVIARCHRPAADPRLDDSERPVPGTRPEPSPRSSGPASGLGPMACHTSPQNG